MADELTPFLALHFKGSRFDAEPGMPVETLTELVAYRELVTEVAKALFRQRNPDRQRVPKGFAERLSLRLRKVGEGSSVPVLERPLPDGLDLSVPDEFEEARDRISEAIEAVANTGRVPDGFPDGALVYFNRLGQGLRDDELIELRTPGTEQGPRYTQSVRKALLSGKATYQRDASTIGWVTEVDADRMRFQLSRQSGSLLPAPIDAVTFDEVKEALAPLGEGPQVRVTGVGVFDRSTDQLVRFDSVHELTLEEIDPPISVDVENVAQSTAGWLDGEGIATEPQVVERAKSLFTAMTTQGCPAPRVYPVPDGGLQAEWSIGNREVSVTVEPGGTLYVIAVDVVAGTAEDATFDDDDPARVLGLVQPNAS